MSCAKTELCIFDKAPPQVVVENACFEEIFPINTITGDSADIEFKIQASESNYLDLNDTLLEVEVQVKNANGKDLEIGEHATPSNFFFYSLFKDVILKLNSTQIEGGNDNYAQKAFFETCLNYSNDTMRTSLTPIGYANTKAGRNALTNLSKKLTMCGSILLDFFNQPKYLIPGINVSLRFQRNTSAFCLTKDDKSPDLKLSILSAKLHVRRVKVVPSVLHGHSIGLRRHNAIYPIRQTKLVKYSLATGSLSFYKDQIFGDMRLPKFVLVTFQKTSALHGDFNKEAATFSHANVSSITLSRNTDYRETYNTDFTANNENFAAAYVKSIIRNLGMLNKNMNIGIDYTRFSGSCPFFTYVLAPDFDVDQKQIAQQGNLKLEIKFRKALTEPTSLLVYGVFDSEIQINRFNEITL